MASLSYIFNEGTDEAMEDYLGERWFNKSNYSSDPTTIFLEHWKYPAEAIFTLMQTGSKAGTIKVVLDNPANPEENALAEYVPDILEILHQHIINVGRKTRRNNNARRFAEIRNKERIGQDVARVYEEKTNRSAKPGTGPANIIRKFLGAQPPINYRETPFGMEHRLFSHGVHGGTRRDRVSRVRRKSHKQRGHKQRGHKQRGGQVVYTPLEGRAIGDPDAIPTVASVHNFKKDGYADFPAPNASDPDA